MLLFPLSSWVLSLGKSVSDMDGLEIYTCGGFLNTFGVFFEFEDGDWIIIEAPICISFSLDPAESYLYWFKQLVPLLIDCLTRYTGAPVIMSSYSD